MTEQDVIFGDDDEDGQNPDLKPGKKEEKEEEESGGPVDSVKVGSVKIDVWKNQGEEGSYYSFDMKRFYTQDDGESFEDTHRMRERDLSDVSLAWQKIALKYGDRTRRDNDGR